MKSKKYQNRIRSLVISAVILSLSATVEAAPRNLASPIIGQRSPDTAQPNPMPEPSPNQEFCLMDILNMVSRLRLDEALQNPPLPSQETMDQVAVVLESNDTNCNKSEQLNTLLGGIITASMSMGGESALAEELASSPNADQPGVSANRMKGSAKMLLNNFASDLKMLGDLRLFLSRLRASGNVNPGIDSLVPNQEISDAISQTPQILGMIGTN